MSCLIFYNNNERGLKSLSSVLLVLQDRLLRFGPYDILLANALKIFKGECWFICSFLSPLEAASGMRLSSKCSGPTLAFLVAFQTAFSRISQIRPVFRACLKFIFGFCLRKSYLSFVLILWKFEFVKKLFVFFIKFKVIFFVYWDKLKGKAINWVIRVHSEKIVS